MSNPNEIRPTASYLPTEMQANTLEVGIFAKIDGLFARYKTAPPTDHTGWMLYEQLKEYIKVLASGLTTDGLKIHASCKEPIFCHLAKLDPVLALLYKQMLGGYI